MAAEKRRVDGRAHPNSRSPRRCPAKVAAPNMCLHTLQNSEDGDRDQVIKTPGSGLVKTLLDAMSALEAQIKRKRLEQRRLQEAGIESQG